MLHHHQLFEGRFAVQEFVRQPSLAFPEKLRFVVFLKPLFMSATDHRLAARRPVIPGFAAVIVADLRAITAQAASLVAFQALDIFGDRTNLFHLHPSQAGRQSF